MPFETLEIKWDEFVSRFKPIKNHIDNNASIDGYMYETFGDEVEYVRNMDRHAPKKVWTVVDCDGETFIDDGYHHVNRMGYIITEVPVPEETFVNVKDD